ncbi:hypothetical protein RhiirB3_531888 [Rhizophagus irregularis]|nr:hypothetical protein RhiirB3_531888 [Rhizophagus irregularis]
MATLWADHKPQLFLTTCGASAFKIIQTSKGKMKLVRYFENWEATLKALGTLQAFRKNSPELKWCQHSLPALKKAPTKQKAKNVPDKKPGKTMQQSGNVNLKKKDQKSSTSAKKQAKSTKDPLKDPKSQKSKSNKKSRDKVGFNDNGTIGWQNTGRSIPADCCKVAILDKDSKTRSWNFPSKWLSHIHHVSVPNDRSTTPFPDPEIILLLVEDIDSQMDR